MRPERPSATKQECVPSWRPLRGKKRRGPRGWLMVEVALGGVMCSTIIGGLIINLGAAVDRTTTISRQMTASMLAQQAIEQARAKGKITIESLEEEDDVEVPVPDGLTGSYQRVRSISAGNLTIGTYDLRYRDVTVTVSFPQKGGMKSVTLESRVFEP